MFPYRRIECVLVQGKTHEDARAFKSYTSLRTSLLWKRVICNVFLVSAVCCMLYAVCCMLYAVCCMLYAVCCMLYAVCCMLNHRSHITYRRGAGGGDALPARGHVHGVGLGRLLPGPCLHFPLCPFSFRLSASPPSTPPPSAPACSGAPPLCPSYIHTCMHTHMHTLWRGKGYACM